MRSDTAKADSSLQSKHVSVGQAVVTAALCGIAGSTATIPLYSTFWWWDLLAHGLAGGAIIAVSRLLRLSYSVSFFVVLAIAVGWELFEPHLPTEFLGIVLLTGDAPSDIAATIVGGGFVLAGFLFHDIGIGR
mgnify:FL=1